MTSPRERTVAALARFEQALRSHGLPLLDMLQPGLTDQEIAETIAPTGLTLPEEAAALWRWRNGVPVAVTQAPGWTPGSELLPGGVHFLPLGTAVDEYVDLRRRIVSSERPDYSPAWFPVGGFTHAARLLVDCGVDRTGPAPMLYWSLTGNQPDELARRTVGSVGEGIEVMAALVERGIWSLTTSGLDGTGFALYHFDREPDDDLPVHWLP